MNRLVILFFTMISSYGYGGSADYLWSGQGGGAGTGAVLDPQYEIVHTGYAQSIPTGRSWQGRGSDGVTRTISELQVSFPGTMEVALPNECLGGQAFIGIVVLRPGMGPIYQESYKAMYGPNNSGGVSIGSYYSISNTGPENPVIVRYQAQSSTGNIYVVSGPAGFYSPITGRPPGGPNQGSPYVFSAGNSPDVVPYIDHHNGPCGMKYNLGDPPIYIPPIVDPNNDLVCNFDIDGDINLGTISSNSAGEYESTVLTTQCNGDATITGSIVTADGSGNPYTQGGVTIWVPWENSINGTSGSWIVREGILNRKSIYGMVQSVGNIIPGEYSKSMIVRLEFE
ncbi:hypothetical protein [Providencia stuartii]|uniref:hypothetical protein n=1 Tax=Providencia stuartii TaxID=588 RepID=UPI000DF87FB2|nr:Uncharacterised protein [Providencia stuartii]